MLIYEAYTMYELFCIGKLIHTNIYKTLSKTVDIFIYLIYNQIDFLYVGKRDAIWLL